MTYASFDEILRDRRIAFTTSNYTPTGVRRAIEARMKELQPDTLDETSEEYRLLSEAHEFLDEHEDAEATPHSTAIMPMPAQTLEKIVEALSGANKPPAPGIDPPEIRMLDHTTRAVTKASTDFRNGRSLPLAGFGALVVAVVGTREVFGVRTTALDRQMWYLGAGGALIVALVVFLLARINQGRDESSLRRLYDPDIQAEALEPAINRARDDRFIVRADYRQLLWHIACWTDTRRPRARPFSTVDIEGAIFDAAQLALERFVAMGVLKVRVVQAAERFYPAEPDDGEGE